MTQAVTKLLAIAVGLLATTGNAELEKAINDLQALGDDAKGSNQEYKDLKEIVEAVEAQGDGNNTGGEDGAGDGADDETPKGDDGATGDGEDTNTGTETQNGADGEDGEAQGDDAPVEPKKYDYAGVRMIGSKWYCAKDKYKKGFATANECAEHFNG